MEWKDLMKECPDCKKNHDLTISVSGSQKEPKKYHIYCNDCGTFTRFDKKDSKEQLIEKWNNRHISDNTEKEINNCIFCDTDTCLSIKINEIITGMHKGSINFNMVCSHCGANTQFCEQKSKAEVIKKWNRRV